jgi:NAD(P)-dependent dehydrogenase (short-subunit alcohol dehydrogenase family)
VAVNANTGGLNAVATSTVLMTGAGRGGRADRRRAGRGHRIVVVGSDTHFGDLRHNLGLVRAPRWEDVRELAAPREGAKAETAREGRTAYSTSKLAVAYLVHAFARRLPDGVG